MSEIHEGNELNQNSEQESIEIVNPTVENGVDRLVEIIDRTVERFSADPSERSLLREGVTAVVRETMQELALAQHKDDMQSLVMGMSRAEMEALTLGNGEVDSTTGSAIDAAARGASQVGTSFVSFTQGLITGTFSAIVQSTIQQMQAYTDMVAELTKSLKDFATDNVSDEAIAAKLAEFAFQEKVGQDTKNFTIAKDSPRRLYHLKRLYAFAPSTGEQKQAILKAFGLDPAALDTPEKVELKFKELETGVVQPPADPPVDAAIKDEATGIKTAAANDAGTYTQADITAIQTAVKLGLAKNGVNQLRQMARDGMARIVVTEGEINTKLTFSVKSDATANRNSSSLNRSQGGFQASASASAGWGWGRASASASGYYDNLSVSTVDEKTISNIQTATEMLGEVRIKFKTDYLPLDGSSGVKSEDLAPIA